MQLHQLRYLRAVIRAGSVTAAAEAEMVAQPAVSKQLQLLEREAGVPLFSRMGRRLAPTDAALQLADLADRVFDDIDSTFATIRDADSAPQHITLCATETVVDHLLPPILSRLLERFPRAELSVEMLGTDDAVARVLGDRADLGIVVLPLSVSRLEVRPLLAEPVLLAVPPGHPFAGMEQVPLSDALADPNLLLSMRGLGLRATVEQAALGAGVPVAGRLELRSQQALLALVASGAGVTFTPEIAVRGRNDVVAVPTEPSLSRQLGWIRRQGRQLPPAARWLIEQLES